jgi:hypothetical protein
MSGAERRFQASGRAYGRLQADLAALCAAIPSRSDAVIVLAHAPGVMTPDS